MPSSSRKSRTIEASAEESISETSSERSMASSVRSSFRYQALCSVPAGGAGDFTGTAGLGRVSKDLLPGKRSIGKGDPERGKEPSQFARAKARGSRGAVAASGRRSLQRPDPADQVVGRNQDHGAGSMAGKREVRHH